MWWLDNTRYVYLSRLLFLWQTDVVYFHLENLLLQAVCCCFRWLGSAFFLSLTSDSRVLAEPCCCIAARSTWCTWMCSCFSCFIVHVTTVYRGNDKLYSGNRLTVQKPHGRWIHKTASIESSLTLRRGSFLFFCQLKRCCRLRLGLGRWDTTTCLSGVRCELCLSLSSRMEKPGHVTSYDDPSWKRESLTASRRSFKSVPWMTVVVSDVRLLLVILINQLRSCC